jgi:hypothetical protein
MTANLKVSQVSANERATDFQRSFPLAALWGAGNKIWAA